MFKNGVKFISGLFTFQYVIQGFEKREHKNYFGEKSFISSDKTIPFHIYKVFRQEERSNIPEGECVCGDARIGIITTSVEV